MKIHAQNPNTIVVELSNGDLRELDITFDEMDYSNIETRRVIWTLLDEARRELGCDIDPSGQMLVEASPMKEGGCEIIFTVFSKRLQRPNRLMIKRRRQPGVFSFDNADALMDACAAVRRCGEPPASDLYRQGSRYALILYPCERDDAIRSVLSEYGMFHGDGPIHTAQAREFGKLLCKGNAVERLAPQ